MDKKDDIKEIFYFILNKERKAIQKKRIWWILIINWN